MPGFGQKRSFDLTNENSIGEDHIIAGTDDLSVLTATVNCIGKLGDKTIQACEERPDRLQFLAVADHALRFHPTRDNHIQAFRIFA